MILDYFVSIITYSLIYILIVTSLNLAYGFTGLVNLGHMAFFGIGAYASALLTLNGMPWYAAMILAGIIASVFGAIMAAITVRLKGDYFQVVTLGLVFMTIAVSRNWISLTRGALGLPGVPSIISSKFYYMLFVLLICSICVLIINLIVKSKTGRIFQAIRDDETAAAILGKNTYFYKVLSISVSTFFAGIAGSLFVHYINFVDPTIFDLEFFVLILSFLIIGGVASIKGTIISVFVLEAIHESLRFVAISPEIIGALRVMLFMGISIVILIFRPRGMFGKVDI
ncbi:MAG: branched-chain amino acid ABC transporter permease [Nanoarchaeota archaeon]